MYYMYYLNEVEAVQGVSGPASGLRDGTGPGARNSDNDDSNDT